jgi:hypothetical protein
LLSANGCIGSPSDGSSPTNIERSLGRGPNRSLSSVRDHRRAGVIDRRPRYRTITPDPEIWREAGVLSGTLARTQGYGREQRRRVLDDALLFATARKYGCVVLSAPVESYRSNSDAEQTRARRRRGTGHSLAFSTVPRSRKVVRHY